MQPLRNLQLLPRVRDSWTYLYVEHAVIDRDQHAIALHQKDSGKVPVPCASLCLLMLGPGTSITHAAIRTLAECGCLVLWTGEEGVRLYAQGLGETRRSRHLLHQARMWADRKTHMQVVRRMYQRRFSQDIDKGWSLRQIRGLEGVRVREAYAQASRDTGVPWHGRKYYRAGWHKADPINRALSVANSCLYGICHAAIVSAGYSPAIGFIHTGRMLSFVYDVADLYKADVTIPVAFEAASQEESGLEGRVRRRCRDLFHGERLLQRIMPDIAHVLEEGDAVEAGEDDLDDLATDGFPADGDWERGQDDADDSTCREDKAVIELGESTVAKDQAGETS